MKTKPVIIVTGASGFIGYQMVRFLEKNDSVGPSRVISVDRLETFSERVEHLGAEMGCAFENKVDPNFLLNKSSDNPLAASKIEAIFHLGACSDTTEMRLDYLKQVNVDYSKHLWNEAARLQIPFIYASSAATYGGGEQGYVDDESKMSLLRPLNPYGQSKLDFDLWAVEQAKQGRCPPIWSGFKFFNVYGFGERHKGKMASVVLQGFDQIRSHGKLRLFKSHRAGIRDGEQKRDFVHVDDVVSVLWFAYKNPIVQGIYNLGSGQARSFLDLGQATFQALKRTPQIEFIDTPMEIRDRYQYFTEAPMQKLRDAGYNAPFLSLEAGVQRTIHELERFHSK